MKRIINDLNNIYNLKQAYIHREHAESLSTFSAEQTTIMRSSIELIEQYFMAAQGIEKSYNEMIFPLENGDNLIAILVDETTIAMLLTEEKINLPMLHMALSLIIKKLNNATLQKLETLSPALVTTPSLPKVVKPNPKSPPVTQSEKPTMPSLKSLFSNPFSAKKSKNKDRPYKNTTIQSSSTLIEKKLVYRE